MRTNGKTLIGLGVGFTVLAAAVAWISAPGPADPAAAPGKDDMPGVVPGPGDITARAATFLSLLDPDARGRATYDLAHEERLNWAFTPVSRNGLPLKDMTLEQHAAAHALLQTTMSSQGYHKANAVIELDVPRLVRLRSVLRRSPWPSLRSSAS